MLPNKIYNNLIHTFCFTLDPLVYFHTFESFSLSSSKIINISLAISLFADDFLCLQDSSPGDNRVCLSANDGGPFIVIDSGASYSVTPLRRDFLPDNLITKSGSVQQLSGKTSVKGFGPVHWRFKLPDTNEHDILPIAHHIPSAGIRLFTPPKRISNNVKVVLSLSITKLVLSFLLVFPFLFLTSPQAIYHFFILFLLILL